MIPTLLQIVTSEQFDSSVEQLTESSIALAEAAANFGALKVIFGIFLVFMLVLMVTFAWQLFSTQRKIEDIHTSTKKVEKYIGETSNRTLGRSQASVLIRRAFNSLSQTVKYNILRTRLENHLDQEEQVQSRIKNLVKYEYAELSSFLMNFECDDRNLSETIKPDDAQIITEFMLEQIYRDPDTFTVSSMDQATDILLSGLKLEALKDYTRLSS